MVHFKPELFVAESECMIPDGGLVRETGLGKWFEIPGALGLSASHPLSSSAAQPSAAQESAAEVS